MVINYRGNAATASETAGMVREAGGEALVVQADIGSAADRARLVQAALDQFGRIDLLVNNAGMGPPYAYGYSGDDGRVLRRGDERQSERAVLPQSAGGADDVGAAGNRAGRDKWRRDRTRRRLSISARLAPTRAARARGEYCISKAGVGMMTLLFADRLAESGINVCEVRPGIVETDMTSTVKEKYDKLIGDGLTPIRRWGQPEDVGKAVAALAEGLFPFSTGAVLDVDGGFHMHRL